MVERLGRDYRGDLIPKSDGGLVYYWDHLEEINRLHERIIGLIKCVHGEFCCGSIEHCDCGREIRELKGEDHA